MSWPTLLWTPQIVTNCFQRFVFSMLGLYKSWVSLPSLRYFLSSSPSLVPTWFVTTIESCKCPNSIVLIEIYNWLKLKWMCPGLTFEFLWQLIFYSELIGFQDTEHCWLLWCEVPYQTWRFGVFPRCLFKCKWISVVQCMS